MSWATGCNCPTDRCTFLTEGIIMGVKMFNSAFKYPQMGAVEGQFLFSPVPLPRHY